MTHFKSWRQFRAAMIATDAIAIILTYFLADILRCHLWMGVDWPELLNLGPPPLDKINSVRIHMKVLVPLIPAWPVILAWLGWYQQRWRSWHWFIRQGAAAAAINALLMAALALLLERDLYPRAQIGFVAMLLPATALLAKGISTLAGRWLGRRQRARVLIVGTSRDAVRFRRLLRSSGLSRPIVVGHLRAPWETDRQRIETGAILGDLAELGPILDGQVIDEVIFSSPLEHLPQILPYVRLCEEVGVVAHIQAESMACHSVPEIVECNGVPLLSYSPTRHSPERLWLKRAFDICLAIIGIALTAPIMLVCAILIKLTSPGPVFFRQRRSGLHGREFQMMKFRTMEPDAEAKLALVSHLNQSDGPAFKIRDDPRATRVGRSLRRWSLDELPQLFNVVWGDMSIVGPRPPIPAEVAQYDRWQRRRLSMRPGLTCLWQIKGRHRIGFEEWMRLDLYYIDNWSLRLDFLILCRTISTVLGGTGA
jgi:exopolysaccharide biosynthesis polyprenyl glycosylphosphotransferase